MGLFSSAAIASKAANQLLSLSTKFGKYSLSRFYCGDAELIRFEDKTFAISNQWDVHDIPALQKIIESYPELNVQLAKAE